MKDLARLAAIPLAVLYILFIGANLSAYADAPTTSALRSQSLLSSVQPTKNKHVGPPPAPKISMQDALRIACDLRDAYCSHRNSLLVVYVHDKQDLKTVNDLTEYESSWVSNFLDGGPVWILALRLKMRPLQRGDNSLLLIDAKNGKLRLDH